MAQFTRNAVSVEAVWGPTGYVLRIDTGGVFATSKPLIAEVRVDGRPFVPAGPHDDSVVVPVGRRKASARKRRGA